MSQDSLSIAAHVDRLKRSGLSVVEYSKRYGVSRWSLYTFRSRQRKGLGQDADKSAGLISRNTPLTFTQLTPQPPIAFKSSEIELVFSDGTRAILPCGFDAADLRKLISIVSATTSIKDFSC
jgi:hypothetical protein